MSREILDKVHKALGCKPIPECESMSAAEKGRCVDKHIPIDHKITLFKDRAVSSGSKIHIVSEKSELKDVLDSIVSCGDTVVFCCNKSLEKLKVGSRELLHKECKLVEISHAEKQIFSKLDVVITDVDIAIAETGSTLLKGRPNCPVTTSTVAPIHVAIIWPGQIVSDMLDWAENYSKNDYLGSNIVLISGPSKTADIEVELVVGVHGPAEFHIIIMALNSH